MTQTNKEVKFKYYSTPSARINDNSASSDDVAFVKNGSAGEIYTKGYKFGMGTVSGDISVEDVIAKSVVVNGVGGTSQSSANTAEINKQYVKIDNSVTNEYIKFTTGGLEYMPEVSQEYGSSSTPTASTLSWDTLISNILAASSSQLAPAVRNIAWSDLSSALQSNLLYVETEGADNADKRTSITGAGGTLYLGSGSISILPSSASNGYPKAYITPTGISYYTAQSTGTTKTWADIVAATQGSSTYWYEESAS